MLYPATPAFDCRHIVPFQDVEVVTGMPREPRRKAAPEIPVPERNEDAAGTSGTLHRLKASCSSQRPPGPNVLPSTQKNLADCAASCNGTERKRVLNVLAQRRYRKRKREQFEALENQVKQNKEGGCVTVVCVLRYFVYLLESVLRSRVK